MSKHTRGDVVVDHSTDAISVVLHSDDGTVNCIAKGVTHQTLYANVRLGGRKGCVK